MSRLDPDKLSVEFKCVTPRFPIIPRRYTLTHSDVTAELFLTIGPKYDTDKITDMRDEVLGEWSKRGEDYNYNVYLHVDGQFPPTTAAIRDKIFRRELPLALEAIRYGDREFFSAHPELDNAPIMVFFRSTNPQFNKVENWGTFSDYTLRSSQEDMFRDDRYLIDMKFGDVTGDGVPDKVYLYGKHPEGSEGFAEDITLVIKDGRTNQMKIITPEFNAGYSPSLFLGDFTKDKVNDIKVSIEAGGSGGYGYFYLYSFKNNKLEELFNFNKYNEEYKFKVDYADLFRVNVGSVMLNKLFILDISSKGFEYLAQYYDEKGMLKQPVSGEVLALGELIPFVSNERANSYDLLATQRIIGTTNSDTLGFIQNLLTWNRKEFVSSVMLAAVEGTNLYYSPSKDNQHMIKG